ncbi:MAG TPA: hypothetical protein VHZ95_08835, partial [Polyangiales bacterium]|nr:hypothetical protein [Polyangiales bacterium]
MDIPVEESARFVTFVALRRMLAIVGMLALVGAVTYFVPSFERVRPWVRGEGMPVVRLFVGERQADLPDFQGAAASSVTVGTPLPESRPLPPKVDPSVGLAISPDEYAELTLPIENVAALDKFYEALRRTAQGAPNAITRIAHYGDSSIAADEISSTARRKLQLRFGDAGHGFMLTARGNMFYGHRDIVHRESSGWQLSSIVRRQLRSGYYGYGGIVATGAAGDYTSFATSESGAVGRSVSRFELFYQRFPGGSELNLSVDKNEGRAISTAADTQQDAWETIQVPDGNHSLTVRARGDVRVY